MESGPSDVKKCLETLILGTTLNAIPSPPPLLLLASKCQIHLRVFVRIKFIKYVSYYCRRKKATLEESKKQIMTDKEEANTPLDIKPPSFNPE